MPKRKAMKPMPQGMVQPTSVVEETPDLNSPEEQVKRVTVPEVEVKLLHCEACQALQRNEDKKPFEEQKAIVCGEQPVIKYKYALTPNVVVRKAIINDLKSLFLLLTNETVKLSGDPLVGDFLSWYERNLNYLVIAANRLNVQNMTVELLSKFCNVAVSKLMDNIDPDSLINQTFTFIRLYVAEIAAKNGVSHEKNS